MSSAIRAEGLGKKYVLHHAGRDRHASFRDVIASTVRAGAQRLVGKRPPRREGDDEEFWALRDVSFDIAVGERIGIIGRNGAGKSTLLKILSRIIQPTTGRVGVKGRVASLLEVGTGFHPELTGRENIFLNGAILGMSRVEIRKKFDAIVNFAGVERFLDTPVKRYSSGMYVRLAFAVAAYLETDVLLVDEVLAVGDLEFQKKCLGRMSEIANEGRTVLFVSHNLASIANLCPRSILLVGGEVRLQGPTSEVISQYIAAGSEARGELVWPDPTTAPGNEFVRLRAVRIVSEGEVSPDVGIQNDVAVEVDFWNATEGALLHTSIHLRDKSGVEVLASANMHSANLTRDEWFGKQHPVGLFRTVCVLPGNFLNEGRYSISVIILSDLSRTHVYERDVINFDVHDTGEMRKEYVGDWLGVVRPKLAWQTTYLGDTQAASTTR